MYSMRALRKVFLSAVLAVLVCAFAACGGDPDTLGDTNSSSIGNNGTVSSGSSGSSASNPGGDSSSSASNMSGGSNSSDSNPSDGSSSSAATYTVTFNKNGGTTEASPTTKTVTYPATTVDALPTEPTRTGYAFTGWTTAAVGGTAFTADTPVTESITVYAQWTQLPTNSYIVTFNRNGGTTDASPRTKAVIAPATTVGTLPAPPAQTGYTFAGWNTAANGGGTAFTASTPVTANITVYAQWTANIYTVTFNKNGGDIEASPTTKTVTYPATTIDALPTPPTRAGYTFQRWTTTATGGNWFTATTTVTASITVYAQWGKNYTFTFDKNGGDTEANPTTITMVRSREHGRHIACGTDASGLYLYGLEHCGQWRRYVVLLKHHGKREYHGIRAVDAGERCHDTYSIRHVYNGQSDDRGEP